MSVLKRAILIIVLIPISVFGWNIKTYDSEILVRKDASFNVLENITVDFQHEYHHGIYRMIPVAYKKKGTAFKVRIKNINVEDENGVKLPFKIRTSGRYMNIRIGDPSRTVTGIQHYVIKYDVVRAFMFTDDYAIFYWNIVGTEWYVPIMSMSATIYFPEEISGKDVFYKVTGGSYASEDTSLTVDSLIDNQLKIRCTKMLNPSEGITLFMKIPRKYVVMPSKIQEVIWFLSDNWIFLIPIIVFIIMFTLWYKNGRNPEFKEYSIVVRYKPPEDLTAAEAGTLIDERCDAQDVNSILIDLARRGYIRIEEIVTKKLLFMKNIDYKITLLKDYKKDKLETYELKFLDALFSYGTKDSILLSSLKNGFYMDYKEIKSRIYKTLVKKGLFVSNPETVRNLYVVWGIIIMIVPVAFAMFFFVMGNISIYLLPVLFFSGLIVMGFGFVMPKKTRKGVLKTVELMGYKEYLLRVEKDELKEKLRENPNLFDEILPYALSLGIADIVATKFLELVSKPPDWYIGSTTGIFTTTMFMNSLGNAMHSFNTTFSSAPSSSGGGSGGGGFSGGGFGGGGGGAW